MTKTILAKNPNGEIQLTMTVPKAVVKKAYEEAFEKVVKDAAIPGFRKGKAPRPIVEEKTDKAKVYEMVLQELVPQTYLAAINEHHLQPIVSPKVELLKAKEDEDWEIRATTCEEPEVVLGSYKEEIKKALAAGKIWTPKNTETQDEKGNPEDEKTQKVIQKLLEVVKVTLPEMLVEDGVTHTLSNLINQTNTLGLTIDQYLNSIGKTSESLRNEYRQKVMEELSLQFILNKVAIDEKIEISEKEIDDLVKTAGDPKLKEKLNTPFERAYLKEILSRRKALETLSKL